MTNFLALNVVLCCCALDSGLVRPRGWNRVAEALAYPFNYTSGVKVRLKCNKYPTV